MVKVIACVSMVLCFALYGQENSGKDELLDKYKNIAREFASEVDEPKKVIFYKCEHVKGDNLAKLLENFLTPRGTVAASKEADMVVISDVASNIVNLQRIADGVDQLVPKIVVEARIVEFTIDNDFEKEVRKWETVKSNADNQARGKAGYRQLAQRMKDQMT